ncbi:MAG: DUF6089 family protein [Bacteroidota bacterium]|nr:DUF6089 family protein [Bacteroidota bacterium]MDX5448279.1 DUF6089 family protein [Bacteroidota bacterium]
MRTVSRLFLFGLMTILLSIPGHAQMHEIGVFGGGTNFIGDVGNYAFHLPRNFVVGGSYRFQFDGHYALRGNFSYGMVENDDATSSWDWRKERNLSFRSRIIEASLVGEFNFFPYVTGSDEFWQTPYIFGGVGVFSFDPETEYEGEWIKLQPLGTEGQGTSVNPEGKYSRSGLAFIFGMGYRLSLARNVSMTLETGFRTTSTDYLDDVSTVYADRSVLAAENGELSAILSDRSFDQSEKTGQPRGNAQNNDWYIYTGITIFVTLTPQRERCTRFW